MEVTNQNEDEMVFVCAGCESSLLVNAAMRDSLLEKGCVICETIPSESDFSPDQ